MVIIYLVYINIYKDSVQAFEVAMTKNDQVQWSFSGHLTKSSIHFQNYLTPVTAKVLLEKWSFRLLAASDCHITFQVK